MVPRIVSQPITDFPHGCAGYFDYPF